MKVLLEFVDYISPNIRASISLWLLNNQVYTTKKISLAPNATSYILTD